MFNVIGKEGINRFVQYNLALLFPVNHLQILGWGQAIIAGQTFGSIGL